MKVLYLINYAGNAGTEKYVENLIRAYHPSRCRCGLCYNLEGPLVERIKALGAPVHRIEMKNPFDLAAAKQLAALCRDKGYDVIHAQYPRENYIALLARRFGSGARVVFTAHLTIEQPLPWRLLNRVMTPGDHRIVALCPEGAEVLARNGVSKARTVTIFNGIDASAMPPRDRTPLAEFGIGEDELALITLARLAPEKGLLFLCDAVARLREKTPLPFRVLLVGEGEQEGELREKIRALSLEDRVILTGFRSDTGRLLAASDLYLNSSGRNEAMSFAILEAMACRLPLVATDVGGNRTLAELEGRSGLIAPYGDAEAYSDALLRLMTDGGLRRSLGETAYQKALGVFSLERSLNKTFDIYA